MSYCNPPSKFKIYKMTSVMNFKIFKVKEKIQMHHPRLLELTTISGVPYKVMNHYSALTIKPIFFYCYFIVILQFKDSSENCCYGVLLFIPPEMERKKPFSVRSILVIIHLTTNNYTRTMWSLD